MRAPEEIKKGLEHCSEDGCKGCNYEDDCNMADGFSVLAYDALAYIKQLEEENNALKQAARDAKKHIENAKRATERIDERLSQLKQSGTDTNVPTITGETSDGYHTFNELYHHRAVLFSVIVKAFPDKAWKSRLHSDGSMFDGMFIVGIDTPDGPATYHYDIEPYWDMFRCIELERAPEWDGHTAEQAINRIMKLEPARHGRWIKHKVYVKTAKCSECKTDFTKIVISDKYPNYCPNCGAKMRGDEDAAD